MDHHRDRARDRRARRARAGGARAAGDRRRRARCVLYGADVHAKSESKCPGRQWGIRSIKLRGLLKQNKYNPKTNMKVQAPETKI